MTSDQPLLRVCGLRVEAKRRGIVALQDLSFDIHAGEVLALLGESGSGKTMAARAVVGLLPPGVATTAGTITFLGQDLASLSPRALRRLRGSGVGMVFQEPMTSLNPALRIGEQLTEGLRVQGLPARDIQDRVHAMLERVGIDDTSRALRSFPHEFSGGMRQRIMLAGAMLARPRLLIADEPTTALDTLSQREVLDLMTALTREVGTAILLITHNLGLVSRYATRAIVLEKGQVREAGAVPKLLSDPDHAYTRALIGAIPRREPRPVVASTFGPPVLSARGLVVRYAPRGLLGTRTVPKTAVDSVDLDVRAGETVALVGGSGSGKTTLGRALLGLVPLTAGDVLYDGQSLAGADAAVRRAFRLDCQLIFQDPFSSLNPRQRVGEIVAEPLRHAVGLDGEQRAARVDEILDSVGLSELARRLPHELSGGQRQRVAIARAIVRRPRLVVADEPISALDMTIQMQVLRLIQALQAQYGFACLFISHDLGAVEMIADRVLVLEGGRIAEQGERDAVFGHPQHPYTRALLAATPTLGFRKTGE